MIINRTPSIWRIMRTDYYALLAVIFLFPVLVMAVLILGLPFLEDPRTMVTSQPFLVVLVGVVLWIVICGGGLALRISAIRSAFTDGQELKGQISEVMFTGTRNNGWVKYTYVYMGTPYTSSNWVVKNDRTRDLAPSSAAQVMVDTSDPRRAFLRDLYL